MRVTSKKPKPKLPKPTNNNQRPNIRSSSSSIRSIIGDRRFNDQFSHPNTNPLQFQGTKKGKRVDVGGTEAADVTSFGQSVSSGQMQTTGGGPRVSGGGNDGAKTSEYAFFKRLKGNPCSNVHVDPNHQDSNDQLRNAQHINHFTSEEIPNVQEERTNNVESSMPVEKQQTEAKYSFLTPPCRKPKISAENVRPGEFNCLSPSVGSKIKTSENKGVFAAKREKLRNLAADRSLYNANELSEGFDLVSALISRILPVVHDNNSHEEPNQDETDSKYKPPPYSESNSTIQIKKSHEAYKRKSIESQNVPYLDDDFSRKAKIPTDKDLLPLEWTSRGSGSFSSGYSPSFSHKHNRCQNGYESEVIKSHHRLYLDDCFSRSEKKPIDMDIMEWNHTGLESSNRYSQHRAANSFKIQNFDIERILSFDEPIRMHESRIFQELDEPKLLEQPQPLLLGWDHNTENDEPFFTSSSTSPPSSPYITRHLNRKHLLTSSIEDCSIKFPIQDYNTWRMDESLNEKEHCISEPFLCLIQSPANKSLGFLNTGLHSILDDDEDKENFVYGSDRLLENRVDEYRSSSYMESFVDKHFDHSGYPLLLHDTSWNDEC